MLHPACHRRTLHSHRRRCISPSLILPLVVLGLAWQAWGWPGVVALCVALLADWRLCG